MLRSAETDAGPIDVPPDVTVTIEFGDGTVNGTNGCNSYGADVVVGADGALDVGTIEQTLIGCDGARADIERAFMDALAAAERFDLDDDTLTLRSVGSTWLFELGAPDDGGPGPSDPVVLDGQWNVTGLTVEGDAVELLPDWPVTFHIEGDRVGGTAACNSYGGTATVDPSADGRSGGFAVGEMSVTEMACEPASVMDVEQAFLEAIQLVDTFSATAQGLRLTTESSETFVDLVAVAPVPDAELTGTTWVLDTYLSGDAASNLPGMEAAFLEFAAEGTLTGSTGCRRLEGEWQLQGATLSIPILSAIDDPTAGVCAPEHDELDRLVIGVVESGVSVEIEGQRLTLTAPGGDGLSFRADG